MGLLDWILGRSKPVAVKPDALFAISTAVVTLQERWGQTPTGAGSVVYRPLSSSYFAETQQEITDLLNLNKQESGSTFEEQTDEFGYRWINVHDSDFSDLVASVHMVTLTLGERGFRDQLLAAAFRFDGGSAGPVYWIYNYKRGTYYPFVPRGHNQRDNTLELKLAAVMERELPMEKSPDQWYALWGIPI